MEWYGARIKPSWHRARGALGSDSLGHDDEAQLGEITKGIPTLASAQTLRGKP